MKKILSLVLALMLLLSIGATVSAEGEEFKVGILSIDQAIEAYASISGYFEDYAEEAGWICTTVSCDYDLATQLTQMENFVAADYDVVMIFQTADPEGILSGVEEAMEAGVFVISYGTPINGGNSELICDNYNAFYELGTQVVNWCDANNNGEGEFALIYGELNSESAWDRYNGVMDALKEHIDSGKIKIVGEQVTQTHDDAMTITETFLTQYPDLDGVISTSGGGGTGANEAIRAAGLLGECYVFACDTTSDVLNILRSDSCAYYCTMCVGSDTYMASKLFEMCEVVKNGEGDTLEESYVAPYQVVTPENVEEYIEQWGLNV